MDKSLSFQIEEVVDPATPLMAEMVDWLYSLFPGYTPGFEAILTTLRHSDSRHAAQVFAGLSDGQLAALAQVFYRTWGDGLLADIDLLGVLEPFRRAGLAEALVRRSLQAEVETAASYGLPALGVVTLIDPAYEPIVALHRKLGGQIRMDLVYPEEDVIVWYPIQVDLANVPTKTLAWQLWQFGGLAEEEFARKYGAKPA